MAIAHDYLTQRGGAERVVLSLRKAFPDAPIYTTLYNPETTFPEFADARITTSWLNKVPTFRRDHRAALPLLPQASNSLRIDADVVVASSTGWAHGFPTTGRRLVYCHSPARYLYLSDQYLGDKGRRSPKAVALGAVKRPLIRWDQRAAHAAGPYLCNSSVVRDRIRDVYGFDAEVVPPPAGVVPGGPQEPLPGVEDWASEGYYLVVSRLLPYKNVDRVIEAFRGLPQRLIVIGRGPLGDELRRSLPPNARLFEGVPDAQLRWAYAHATALVAPSYEDFGLTPLEAGAYGKPTLALHGGGYLDTITDGVNGAFFESATPDAIAAAVRDASSRTWDAASIDACMAPFSEETFIRRIREHVDRLTTS